MSEDYEMTELRCKEVTASTWKNRGTNIPPTFLRGGRNRGTVVVLGKISEVSKELSARNVRIIGEKSSVGVKILEFLSRKGNKRDLPEVEDS